MPFLFAPFLSLTGKLEPRLRAPNKTVSSHLKPKEIMETINICLKELTNNKKAVKERFQLKQVRNFSRANELKNLILTSHSEKFEVVTFDNLQIGFYGPPRGMRFAINDETTLAEAYSTEKQQWVVIWAWSPPGEVANKRSHRQTFKAASAASINTAKRFCLSSKSVTNVFSIKRIFPSDRTANSF